MVPTNIIKSIAVTKKEAHKTWELRIHSHISSTPITKNTDKTHTYSRIGFMILQGMVGYDTFAGDVFHDVLQGLLREESVRAREVRHAR